MLTSNSNGGSGSFIATVTVEREAREAAISVQEKSVDLQRKKSKVSLRKLDEQPEWLKGGKLRDYQLEGLNFLVNRMIEVIRLKAKRLCR
uniref:Uncharacterized protein n=1 Tax=Cucumis melo TaxID=3656 RepID=A0A9I9E935_CUCME